MQRRPTKAVFIFALLTLMAPLSMMGAAPARAEPPTCASEPVTARGEQARFLWIARTKARANWRRKVRGMSNLGPDYAVWPRAINTEERCLEGPAGTLCIFTGTPCR